MDEKPIHLLLQVYLPTNGNDNSADYNEDDFDLAGLLPQATRLLADWHKQGALRRLTLQSFAHIAVKQKTRYF